ncbi:MAG: UbiA family prenyltransferase [Methanosarcinales archaeon]
MHPILELIRPLTSLMVGFAVFISALIGTGLNIASYILPVLLAVTVAYFFTASGNALNDYLDRETDKINHPNRPIPSGRIQPKQALTLAIVTFGLVIILAWFINLIAFVIAGIALLIQLAYEKYFKYRGFIGNIMIAAQTAFAFLFGGVAVGQIKITSILALLAFFSILGREIVKDIEDMEGDLDRFTLPMKYGRKKASIVASFFFILSVVMSPLPYYPLQIFGGVYLPLVAIADIIFIYSLFIQFKNPKYARKTAKAAMLIALLAFLAGGLL